MRLKFALQSGSSVVDLVATTDANATVGDLAWHLDHADPARSPSLSNGQEMTLALVDGERQTLDPRTTVAESGLFSGDTVTLVRAGGSFVEAGRAVAMVVITAGPDAGREIPLPRGTAYIGRGRGCEVTLADGSVSRRHLKLILTDVAEVVDLGSANGITAEGQQVTRAQLKSGDTIGLGDTELEVHLLGGAATGPPPGVGVIGTDGGVVSFSRSPRLAPIHAGKPYVVPDLPERPRPQPFPVVSLIIPIIMAVVLYVATKNALSLLFLAMMPMMIAGQTFESRRQAKKEFEREMTDFREDLELLVSEIHAEHDRERTGRLHEHPSGMEVLMAMDSRGELLWTRRPGDPGFLELRFGTGTRPSRSTVELPRVGRSRAEAWLEVSRTMTGVEMLDGVPVVAEPLKVGAIGVCGPRETAVAAARSLVLQAAGLHSPAELIVLAFASTRTAPDWDFLKWLPHTSSPHSPFTARATASTAPACAALADELEDLVESLVGAKDEEGGREEPYVVVVVEGDAPIARSRLVDLAERGHRAGIVVVWVAERQAMLPASCRTFLVTRQGGLVADTLVGYVHEGTAVAPVFADEVSALEALNAARRLSPVVDSGVAADDVSDLPRAVSLVALTGTELMSSATAQIERWKESRSILTGPFAPAVPSRKPGNLRAVVGQSGQGTLTVDLRADGPHALVGGTTGAGKSELLQAWILGIAAAHSPQRVTFLLVDYKGGSAFRDCVRLPHTVGLVTDLSPHLVRRALESLSAELRYREHLLARHKAKDLIELERRGEVDAPPSLIIVVDEFAALVNEVPEFVDGVVNVAQRGRSLGLHLILATQRPAGVIKDNLRANTNLRLALRMADEADSDDVLGSSAAAFFDPGLPGRAMVKSGPGRLTPFQTAYAGGWTSDTPPPAELTVATLAFGGEKEWQLPDPQDGTEGADPGPTDIQRLVTTIREASATAEIPQARKPWQPELQEVYDLVAVPTARRDNELVFGIADHPHDQEQPPISFHPDSEGNIAVYGASGSGKSVLLRTIAIAAGFTVRGGPCQVYGLDFGNRGLAMLEELPYVGSIVPGGDHERVVRLLRYLRGVIDERAVRYSKVSSSTITEYRRLAGQPDEPRILVLLDGMTAFRQAYEVGGRLQYLDMVNALAGDGRPVGVHFIISVDQRSGMPQSLGAAIQRRVVLRLPSADDYAVLGVPGDVLTMASPAGRGLFNGDELQVAVLGGSSDVSIQAASVRAFAEATRKAGGTEAPPIESLVERVTLAELPATVDGLPVIGVASETLGPKTFEPRGCFMIVGPSGSGRTTALATMAMSLDRFNGRADLYLLTPRKRSELIGLGVWTSVAAGVDDVVRLAQELTAAITQDRLPHPIALVIERVDDLGGSTAENVLTTLVKACLDNDQFVIAEGEAQFFGSNFGLAGVLKTSRSGLSLHPDGNEGHPVFRANLPALNRSELPEGRGFFVDKGRFELVQVAI